MRSGLMRAADLAAGFTLPTTFPATFGAGPTDHVSVNIGDYSAAREIPASVLQGLVSKVVVPTSYTQAPWPNTAISGYVLNGNTTPGNSAVAILGFVGTTADVANPFGGNLIVSNASVFNYASGSGHDFQGGVGLEINANIVKKGVAAPHGILFGLKVGGGNSEAAPTLGANAVEVARLA
jgi:hypothetical protein